MRPVSCPQEASSTASAPAACTPARLTGRAGSHPVRPHPASPGQPAPARACPAAGADDLGHDGGLLLPELRDLLLHHLVSGLPRESAWFYPAPAGTLRRNS